MGKQSPGQVLLFMMLTAGLAVSGLITTKTLLDKRALSSAYTKAQAELTQLQHDREQLSNALAQAQQTVGEQTTDVVRLQTELTQIETLLERIQQEVVQLQQDNATLTQQASDATRAKQQLEAKLSSIHELKLAIRDIRRKMWQERWQSWLARIDEQRQRDQVRLASGNRGFVVREGSSTLASSSMKKVQVRVLDPQPQ